MNANVLKEKSRRLFEINNIIKQLDLSIRPAAFELLQDYVQSAPTIPTKAEPSVKFGAGGNENREDFFSKYQQDKPADNVMLIVAYDYNRYGSLPLAVSEIKSIANDVGLIIPERVDKTLTQAQRDGKMLFRRAENGNFQLTVHGEIFLKSTYNVAKGTGKKPVTS